MNDKQAMIEKMKTNKEAFMFWSNEWQDFARKNRTAFCIVGVEQTVRDSENFDGTRAYQLSTDFQLPAERWFYHKELIQLFSMKETACTFGFDNLVEIPAEYVPYVKKCIELHNDPKNEINLDKFELRLTQEGEMVDWLATVAFNNRDVLPCLDTRMRFVRKSAKEPNKVPIPDDYLKVVEPVMKYLAEAKRKLDEEQEGNEIILRSLRLDLRDCTTELSAIKERIKNGELVPVGVIKDALISINQYGRSRDIEVSFISGYAAERQRRGNE